MIKFEHTEVLGWEAAIRGMRNPMNSWDKSDSFFCQKPDEKCSVCEGRHTDQCYNGFVLGPNDLDLMKRLCNAGTDHRKFMRMIVVYADLTAPMYWWSEYDTYKIGTVANSTSKMHKMLAKPFEMNDFSFDKLPGWKNEVGQYIPDFDYDKEIWKEIGKTGYEVSDLEWVTSSENSKHAHAMGLQPRGLSTYKGKFTDEQREEIKTLWNSGKHSRREIARMYGVSHTCINDILNDKYRYATKVNVFETVARPIVDTLNELRDTWIRETDETKKKQIWYAILQLLPVSYNQRRTVMLNYEVLANIYKSRRNHKLDEWREHDNVDIMTLVDNMTLARYYAGEYRLCGEKSLANIGFCDWVKTLPYSELITGKECEV